MKISTRLILLNMFLLSCIGVSIGVAIVCAQDKQANAGAASCAPSEHRHRYSDLRIALVEVKEHDACGFRFSDLERPVSDRVQLDADFTLAEVQPVGESRDLHTTSLPPSALRAGLRGLIVYCGVCRTVFSLKSWKKEK